MTLRYVSRCRYIPTFSGCVCMWSSLHRRLADGNVHSADSGRYQICFRLPIPNANPNPKNKL